MITSIQPYNQPKNYRTFNPVKVTYLVNKKEQALPYLAEVLGHTQNENEIVEDLYILNKTIDAGTPDVKRMYPVLSRFNNTNSPEIQTFLAGIYRKLQIPDAFGPLVSMLIRNSFNPHYSTFDPNEEIGGAVLAYLSDRFNVDKNINNSL